MTKKIKLKIAGFGVFYALSWTPRWFMLHHELSVPGMLGCLGLQLLLGAIAICIVWPWQKKV